MITAYVQANPEGRLEADSTITIEGVTYPIPERGTYGSAGDYHPSKAAPHRISTALESAGYRRGYSTIAGADENGLITIEVRRA